MTLEPSTAADASPRPGVSGTFQRCAYGSVIGEYRNQTS